MSKRDNKLLLLDMKVAIEKIQNYTTSYTLETFRKDDKTVDAVVRNFEIVGEAANRVSDDFKSNHPEIEWRKLRGFRNRIVHEYFGIDIEIVWAIVENDMEELHFQIDQLINSQ